jgi:hypothetical protein
MKNEIILRIKPHPQWDNGKFIEDIANDHPVSFVGCDVALLQDLFFSLKEEIAEEVARYGLSNLLRLERLVGAVVEPGQTKNFVENLMVKFLQNVDIDNELIIVDPYFYASTADRDYPQFVANILRPFHDKLSTIKIITLSNKVNAAIKTAVENEINSLNSTIDIQHTTSDLYHDRFWITGKRAKGIIAGTSLNGLGRRYAIIDKLHEDDVKDIVNSLISNNLI